MNQDKLYRFFEGKATIEEENHIRNWMETSDTNKKTFMQGRKMYDSLLLASPNHSTSHQKEKRSFLWNRFGTVAAALLLLIVSTLYVRTLMNNGDSSQMYNSLVVPAGQRMHLILSDNTGIWLNANSTLRYPTEFSKKNRTVYLDGEAYFEVSKNDKKPFVVKTSQGDIKVTGTSFNVEAYSKQGGFETSLFEGSVEIYQNNRQFSLKPNEMSFLKEGKLYITPITDRDKFLWKEGLIAFNNKSLEDILLSLEKYFDIRIQVSTNLLPQHTFTGKFRQSDGVDYALRVLQKSIRFTFERDEESGIVYIK